METKVNFELKYFCTDFNSIRKALIGLGAKRVSIKNQKDYFFNLPAEKEVIVRARLKMRVEDGVQRLVFYRRPDFSPNTGTSSDVTLLIIKDRNLLKFFSKALGVRAIVEKKRELWKKDNTVFHLDTVKGIGKIFEIEILSKAKRIKEDRLKLNRYRGKFFPYLDKIVKGSNEDLVRDRKT